MPVDEFDTACRNLQWGYQCASIESIERFEESCDPWAIDYHPVENIGEDDDLTEACENANKEHPSGNVFCAVQACVVETQFILHLEELQS